MNYSARALQQWFLVAGYSRRWKQFLGHLQPAAEVQGTSEHYVLKVNLFVCILIRYIL